MMFPTVFTRDHNNDVPGDTVERSCHSQRREEETRTVRRELSKGNRVCVH